VGHEQIDIYLKHKILSLCQSGYLLLEQSIERNSVQLIPQYSIDGLLKVVEVPERQGFGTAMIGYLAEIQEALYTPTS
jgi:hypothetical protein